MMKKMAWVCMLLCLTFCFIGCSANQEMERAGTETVDQANGRQEETENLPQRTQEEDMPYTGDTKIADVIADPVFENYGRLIFPADSGYYSGDTLGDLRLTWYSNIDPDKTVEIVNYMKDHAAAGDTIFFDIYTDEKKTPDFSSSKEIPEKNLPYAMQAADLPMLEPCRIASLMPWSYPKWDTMRLL